MAEITYLERIGKLTVEYYVCESERVKTRLARAEARANHPCTNEGYDSETFQVHPLPCHLDVRLKPEDWCDGCKYVQSFWLTYQAASEKTRKAKYRLSRRIKTFIAKGWSY